MPDYFLSSNKSSARHKSVQDFLFFLHFSFPLAPTLHHIYSAFYLFVLLFRVPTLRPLNLFWPEQHVNTGSPPSCPDAETRLLSPHGDASVPESPRPVASKKRCWGCFNVRRQGRTKGHRSHKYTSLSRLNCRSCVRFSSGLHGRLLWRCHLSPHLSSRVIEFHWFLCCCCQRINTAIHIHWHYGIKRKKKSLKTN